ncbi:MAG: PAS domain S-box protein [Thermodesulfovibrionales bacterium]|nr:PAS domain S-box protein [Thermodesulfovibrionales bacterium]
MSEKLISNCLLFANNRLVVIFELIKSILQFEDFSLLLKKITEETAKAFNANVCLLRLYEDGKLKVKSAHGIPEIDQLFEKLTVEVGEGIAGKTFTLGKTTVFDAPEDVQSLSALSHYYELKNAICTPLKIGDRTIGTFGLYNKISQEGSIIPFSNEDQLLLECFASIAAIVIDKFTLHKEIALKEKEAIETRKSEEKLRDLLENLIENSPDAIVTTDLNGVVTSWNKGAEKIYGFTKEEAIGKPLPFIPEALIETEQNYLKLLKEGQYIRDIETIRKTKDGRIIDVNLTLSPVKDLDGNVIATSGISRDISHRKKIEKELRQKNEELLKIYFISSAMRSTLELNKLLRMLLTSVTIGDGFGFNRAILFLLDENKKILRGTMGVGPANFQEATEIWSRLWKEGKSLHDLIDEIEKDSLKSDSYIDNLCCKLEIPIDNNNILSRVVRDKVPLNITNTSEFSENQSPFVDVLESHSYALIPLISKDNVIGVLWVDNLFTGRAISSHDIDFLKSFTDQMASAIENARLFERIVNTEKEMENIFESISDMLYFNSPDYTIKRINKAVVEKIGKPAEEILGRKCYEIFHNKTAPWEKCPHHKTIKTKKPFIEEVDDPNLGGTFLVSSSPIFDQKNNLLGTIHVVRDVSELKRLREKLIASERMAALGEMAAKVAHEIRNPLLSIGGFAKRLEKNLTGDLLEYAKIIVDETRRLERVLSDILIFVKSGHIERKKVNLDELLENIKVLLLPEIEERGNILIKDMEKPFVIPGDQYRLKEVFINIINNANQATDHGQISIRAYLKQNPDYIPYEERSKEFVVVEISDNGCGIKKEDLSRIFDPFFTTRTTGTGLGLSISKRIVEEHGGKIEVESVWSEGTVFKIYLPLKEDE